MIWPPFLSVTIILARLVRGFDFAAEPPIHVQIDPAAISPFVQFYETFPIFDEIVIQQFHFTSSHPIILDLHDAFCTGNGYEVYDNNQLLASGESILNFCGISASPLHPGIGSPTFLHIQFELDAGSHQLDIVIFHSQIGSNKTSMQITLKPFSGCLEGSLVNITKMEQLGFPKPEGFKMEDFKLADYIRN